MSGLRNWGSGTLVLVIKTMATKRDRVHVLIRSGREDGAENSNNQERTLRLIASWHRSLFSIVRESWLQWICTGAKEQSRFSHKRHEQGMFRFFWRSQNPSCCDWGWLCRKQNGRRSQASWWMRPVTPGNEGRGQCTWRQRVFGLSQSTHSHGRQITQMDLQSGTGKQWSSWKIKSKLSIKFLQKIEGLY